MATRSRMTITVTKSTSQSTVTVRSTGRYATLDTNGEDLVLSGQPLFTTSDEAAYWTAVLAVVQPMITGT